MPFPNYQCHREGAACYVRIRGDKAIRTGWMIGVVVQAVPLVARVLAAHPIWHGAEVSQRDAAIRVDPRMWPAGVVERGVFA